MRLSIASRRSWYCLQHRAPLIRRLHVIGSGALVARQLRLHGALARLLLLHGAWRRDRGRAARRGGHPRRRSCPWRRASRWRADSARAPPGSGRSRPGRHRSAASRGRRWKAAAAAGGRGGRGARSGAGEYCPRSMRVVWTTAIWCSIITLAAMASAATAANEVASRPAMPIEKPRRNRALMRNHLRPRAAPRCANPGPMEYVSATMKPSLWHRTGAPGGGMRELWSKSRKPTADPWFVGIYATKSIPKLPPPAARRTMLRSSKRSRA